MAVPMFRANEPSPESPRRDRRGVLTTLAVVAAALLALLLPTATADHDVDEGCAVTPGGWRAPPAGNNPARLLYDHFDEVFGEDGFTVDGYTFEDPEDVTLILNANRGDPLLQHTVALHINLAFGSAGLLDGTLSGVTVESENETLDGKTAGEILALGVAALEDPDRSTSKYSDLIDAMSGLNNEAFGCNAFVPCPENVMAVPQSDGSILVSWDEVEVAIEYNVYRATGEDGEFMLLATVTDTEYSDTTTAVGQMYRYAVTASDGETESEDCEAVMATAIPFFPAAVVGAVALAGSVGAFALLRRRSAA